MYLRCTTTLYLSGGTPEVRGKYTLLPLVPLVPPPLS
jgi:hypothetical protein